jgi:hypothetical protein
MRGPRALGQAFAFEVAGRPVFFEVALEGICDGNLVRVGLLYDGNLVRVGLL